MKIDILSAVEPGHLGLMTKLVTPVPDSGSPPDGDAAAQARPAGLRLRTHLRPPLWPRHSGRAGEPNSTTTRPRRPGRNRTAKLPPPSRLLRRLRPIRFSPASPHRRRHLRHGASRQRPHLHHRIRRHPGEEGFLRGRLPLGCRSQDLVALREPRPPPDLVSAFLFCLVPVRPGASAGAFSCLEVHSDDPAHHPHDDPRRQTRPRVRREDRHRPRRLIPSPGLPRGVFVSGDPHAPSRRSRPCALAGFYALLAIGVVAP